MRLASKVTTAGIKATRLRFAKAWPNSARTSTFGTSTNLLKIRVRVALGADLSASWLTWNWLDISDRVQQEDGIDISAGRRDWSSFTEASTCRLRIDNQDGYFSRRNPMSPYYELLTKQTPIWVTVDPGSGEVTRFQGYVNEWPVRWADKAATVTTVPITCSGVLRRLTHGTALKGPLYRTMSGVAPSDYQPYVYWPLEDESGSTQLANAVANKPPLAIPTGVTLAGDSTLTGSAALPTMASGSSLPFAIPAYTNRGQCVIQWAYKLNAEPASETTIAEFYASSGPVRTWRVTCLPGSPAALWLYDIDSTGTVINSTGLTLDGSGAGNPSESAFFGHWAIYTFAPTQSGSTVSSWFGMTLSPTRSGMAFANIDTGTLGIVTGGKIAAAGGASVGHVFVCTDPRFTANFTSGDALNNVAAMNGYTGEAAHTRFARLCREENIPGFTVAATSVAMGVQPSSNLLAAIRECEAVDQGFLYEREFGLAYQSSYERLNAPVSMTLDFASQHIQETPEPADDDQRLINRVRASRSGGSWATVQDDDSITDDGLYETQVTTNVTTDSQLLHQAGWRVHMGTVDEDRWPKLDLKLHATPDLISQWVGMPLGGRLQVTNPPVQMAPVTIDAVLESYTEHIDLTKWIVSLNTSPYSPYEAFTLETGTGNRSRLSVRGSLIGTGGILSGTTSMLVTTTGRPWITTASFPTQFPFDITVGGERMTVTAIVGATSPQTFTVTRTLAKDHVAGEELALYRPPVFALRGNT